MFSILNSYLFLHKSISVPGLGTIYLEKNPARIDDNDKSILPPSYHFRFDKYFDAPDKDFFLHLAAEKNIPDYEAIKWYNEFSYELRNKIRQDNKAEWEGVGILKKDDEGNIIFESTSCTPSFIRPVAIERTGKPTGNGSPAHDESNITVTPSGELVYQDVLAEEKSKWWVYPLIAAAIASAVLIFHFSSNGWKADSMGNQHALEIAK
ncbi:MAG: hypothetical protein JST47_01420 [Bacteroidetes bacterium]|nr:hypothetical protein [Bacteroidota bacterium]